MDSITFNTGTKFFKSISKKYKRDSIYEYDTIQTSSKKCQHASWFGLSMEKAEYYRKKNSSAETHTYISKTPAQFFIVNSLRNLEVFYRRIQTTKQNLRVFFDQRIPEEVAPHFKKYDDYLKLTKKEKAIFEYEFAFGMLSTQKQTLFLKLVLKLQEYKLIETTKKMEGNALTNQIMANPYFQRVVRQFINLKGRVNPTHQEQFEQRFSMYQIDINVLHNLCVILPKSFSGYIFLHQPSIWHKQMADVTEVAIFDTTNVL